MPLRGFHTCDIRGLAQARRAMPDAFMCAIDSIEIIGLTPEAVGNAEASQT